MRIGLAADSEADPPSAAEPRAVRKWSLGAWNGRAASAVVSLFIITTVLPSIMVSSLDFANVEDDPHFPAFMNLVLGVGVLSIFVGLVAALLLVVRVWLSWQTVILDDQTLTIERSVFGRSRRKKYLRRYIGEMHVAADVPTDAKTAKFHPNQDGVFAFRYGIQTVRFGPEMMKSEAEKKLAQILAFAPDLAAPAPIPDQAEGGGAEWSSDPDSVSPLERRYVLEHRDQGVRITIPPASNGWVRAFSLMWLVGWGIIMGNALPTIWVSAARLQSGLPVGDNITDLKMRIGVLSLWILLWSFWAVFALRWLVWSKWGRQVIEISPARIVVRNSPTLLRHRRVIARQHAGPIYVGTDADAPAPLVQWSDRAPYAGWLACKNQVGVHHFGAGLTRNESEYLLEQLRRVDSALVGDE